MTLSLVIATAFTLPTIIYACLCALSPFRTCRRCGGAGQRRALIRTKQCSRCRGTGLRLRLGRRAWNRIQAVRAGR